MLVNLLGQLNLHSPPNPPPKQREQLVKPNPTSHANLQGLWILRRPPDLPPHHRRWSLALTALSTAAARSCLTLSRETDHCPPTLATSLRLVESAGEWALSAMCLELAEPAGKRLPSMVHRLKKPPLLDLMEGRSWMPPQLAPLATRTELFSVGDLTQNRGRSHAALMAPCSLNWRP